MALLRLLAHQFLQLGLNLAVQNIINVNCLTTGWAIYRIRSICLKRNISTCIVIFLL